jgi:hypothetical protein
MWFVAGMHMSKYMLSVMSMYAMSECGGSAKPGGSELAKAGITVPWRWFILLSMFSLRLGI